MTHRGDHRTLKVAVLVLQDGPPISVQLRVTPIEGFEGLRTTDDDRLGADLLDVLLQVVKAGLHVSGTVVAHRTR